jgi:hypothetical protein
LPATVVWLVLGAGVTVVTSEATAAIEGDRVLALVAA